MVLVPPPADRPPPARSSGGRGRFPGAGWGWGLALSTAGATAAALGLPDQSASSFVRHFGPILLGGQLAALALAIVWWIRMQPPWATLRREWWGWTGAILLGLWAAGRGPAEYRVVQDELVQSATALSLHQHGEAWTAQRGYWVDGRFVVLAGYLDKRPLLHPVLLALVHDLTGYRPDNAFHLNRALAVVAAVACYGLGRVWAGPPGGWLAGLLWAGLPIWSESVRAAGFTALNGSGLLVVLWFGFQVVRSPSRPGLLATLLAGLLTTQIRYESGAILGWVAVLGWFTRDIWRGPVAWVSLAAPWCLVPWFWQQRHASGAPAYLQQEFRESAFSWNQLWENGWRDLIFLLDPGRHAGNSLAFTGLAAVGLGMALFLLLRRRRPPGWTPAWTWLAGTAAALGVLWFVLTASYWGGRFDWGPTRRLALPLYVVALCPFVLVLADRARTGGPWGWLLAVAALGGWWQTVPAPTRGLPSPESRPAWEENWKDRFLAQQPEGRTLWLDRFPFLAMTRRLPSATWAEFAARPEDFARHQAWGTYDRLCGYRELSPGLAGWIWAGEIEIPPGWTIHVLHEQTFAPGTRGQIVELRAPPLSAGPGGSREEWAASLP